MYKIICTLVTATREGGLSAEETEWRGNDAFNSREKFNRMV